VVPLCCTSPLSSSVELVDAGEDARVEGLADEPREHQ
jgi:hypothetical protein